MGRPCPPCLQTTLRPLTVILGMNSDSDSMLHLLNIWLCDSTAARSPLYTVLMLAPELNFLRDPPPSKNKAFIHLCSVIVSRRGGGQGAWCKIEMRRREKNATRCFLYVSSLCNGHHPRRASKKWDVNWNVTPPLRSPPSSRQHSHIFQADESRSCNRALGFYFTDALLSLSPSPPPPPPLRYLRLLLSVELSAVWLSLQELGAYFSSLCSPVTPTVQSNVRGDSLNLRNSSSSLQDKNLPTICSSSPKLFIRLFCIFER